MREALLEQDGVRLDAPSSERLDASRVGPLLTRVRAPLTLEMNADEVRSRCRAEHDRHVYPVVDAEKRVIGIITPEDLSLLDEGLARLVTAFDVMRAPLSVKTSDKVGLALERMLANGVRELPVTDEAGRLVGMIDDLAVATALQHPALRGGENASSSSLRASTGTGARAPSSGGHLSGDLPPHGGH